MPHLRGGHFLKIFHFIDSAEPIETIINHEMRLHEINTLEWDELVVPDGSIKLNAPAEGGT